MSIPATVVPGYPYDGGLYWMLGGASVRNSRGNPYYASLYGANPELNAGRAGALVALFESVELPVADHALPSRQELETGDGYVNPDLRLSVSYNDAEWSNDARALSEFMMEKKSIRASFAREPLFRDSADNQLHFLSRLVLQVRLAIRLNAVIVGDDLFQSIFREVSPHIKQFLSDLPGQLPDGLTLNINETFLSLTALNFAPSSYDEFVAIRTSRHITDYATAFRGAIGKAREAGDLNIELRRLMKEAMDSEEISRRVATAMQSTASVSTVISLVPVAGTLATLAGLSSDLAGREADARAKRQQWFLLGAKMKEIAIRRALNGPVS